MSTQLIQMTLRHYGAKEYDPKKFSPVRDAKPNYFRKPMGGLWASPVDSEYSWSNWCEDNNFGNLTEYFDFVLHGFVLRIDSYKDAKTQIPWSVIPGIFGLKSPEFEPLIREGVDAIWLTIQGMVATRLSSPYDLYGWDCECVLIMNPKSIYPSNQFEYHDCPTSTAAPLPPKG